MGSNPTREKSDTNAVENSGMSHLKESIGPFVEGISEKTSDQDDRMPAERIEKVTGFDRIVNVAYSSALAPEDRKRPKFNITWWETESGLTTLGGLATNDRILLASIYGKAESVFEWGLGESTYMADYLGVKRYSGIDNDAAWVGEARDKVGSHFRFYFADVGETYRWGIPVKTKLRKNVLNYQLSPLIVEPLPFDVYMVDGRWRVPCALTSFLHASARGADLTKTTVLVHDCKHKVEVKKYRGVYDNLDTLFDLVDHSGDRLCVYQRKSTTTDEDIVDLWESFKYDFHRKAL